MQLLEKISCAIVLSNLVSHQITECHMVQNFSTSQELLLLRGFIANLFSTKSLLFFYCPYSTVTTKKTTHTKFTTTSEMSTLSFYNTTVLKLGKLGQEN
jgi:hypothetical protein